MNDNSFMPKIGKIKNPKFLYNFFITEMVDTVYILSNSNILIFKFLL